MPQFSLVICTRNRARSLQACLAAVAAAGDNVRGDWEVVIVDNGSTDDTAAVADAFVALKRCFPVHYVCEPTLGVSHAKNRALTVAAGAAVMFIDDDCYLEHDYFAAVETLLADDSVDYFGGRVLLHDPADDPVTTKDSLRPEPMPPGSFVLAGVIHGANMGFRRRVMDRIGGFNIAMGPGAAIPSGEDTEYIARASAAGFAGGYFPGPAVRHHHGRKANDALKLYRAYDYGRGACFASMILSSRYRWLYLKQWLSLLSCRRASGRELAGAFKYARRWLLARMAGRELTPRKVAAAVDAGLSHRAA